MSIKWSYEWGENNLHGIGKNGIYKIWKSDSTGTIWLETPFESLRSADSIKDAVRYCESFDKD